MAKTLVAKWRASHKREETARAKEIARAPPFDTGNKRRDTLLHSFYAAVHPGNNTDASSSSSSSSSSARLPRDSRAIAVARAMEAALRTRHSVGVPKPYAALDDTPTSLRGNVFAVSAEACQRRAFAHACREALSTLRAAPLVATHIYAGTLSSSIVAGDDFAAMAAASSNECGRQPPTTTTLT